MSGNRYQRLFQSHVRSTASSYVQGVLWVDKDLEKRPSKAQTLSWESNRGKCVGDYMGRRLVPLSKAHVWLGFWDTLSEQNASSVLALKAIMWLRTIHFQTLKDSFSLCQQQSVNKKLWLHLRLRNQCLKKHKWWCSAFFFQVMLIPLKFVNLVQFVYLFSSLRLFSC